MTFLEISSFLNKSWSNSKNKVFKVKMSRKSKTLLEKMMLKKLKKSLVNI